MDKAKYVFAGNRASVLEKMFEMKLDIVKIWAVENSYLQRYLDEKKIEYSLIRDKKAFVNEVETEEFNYFISNGLPIILPVGKLSRDNKKYINIHPSLLPELRGKDPVPGALLYQKPIGVTCHYMDEGIDSGDIIAQVEIDRSPDLEAGLLYQLSFMAEAEVFEKAYKKGFAVEGKQRNSGDEIYYSFSDKDLEIDIKADNVEKICARVKAFSTRNKGAILQVGEKKFRCWSVEVIKNKYLRKRIESYINYNIVLKYEDKILVRKDDELLKFIVN